MKILCVHLLREWVLWLDIRDRFPCSLCCRYLLLLLHCHCPQHFTSTPGSSAWGSCGRVLTASGGWDSQRSSGSMTWDVLAGSCSGVRSCRDEFGKKALFPEVIPAALAWLLAFTFVVFYLQVIFIPHLHHLNFAWEVRCSWKCVLNVMLWGH